MKEKINSYWGSIADLMNDDIREKVHIELAPCTNEEFLKRYVELDHGFNMVLWNTFRIDIGEI